MVLEPITIAGKHRGTLAQPGSSARKGAPEREADQKPELSGTAGLRTHSTKTVHTIQRADRSFTVHEASRECFVPHGTATTLGGMLMRDKGHLLVRWLHSAVFFCLFFLFFSLSSALPANSADITLAWDPSTEPEWLIGGYNIYYNIGYSGPPYDQVVTISLDQDENLDPDIVEYTLTDLDDSEIYFIAVTVFTNDEFPIESDYSNEVSVNPMVSRMGSRIDFSQIDSGEGSGGCFLKILGF
jgi:hypothetical protein